MESSPKRKVLVVDDQEDVLEAVKWMLEEAGIQVVTAPDGKVAQVILESQNFDAVLSDIQMGPIGTSGIELLHFVKKTSSTPVILMTGFSHILEVQEAYHLGAFGFLSKPFKEQELLKVIKSSWKEDSENDAEDTNLDDKYCRLNIEDFICGKIIQFGIYIRLSQFKYVKIASQGEDISLDRIRSYKKKGVKYLYLEESDFQNYLKMSLLITKVAQDSAEVSREKRQALMKHTTEVLFDYLFSHDFDEETFADAKLMAENSVRFLSNSDDTYSLLMSLNAHGDYLYAHSLGVSCYAIMIARQLGWTSHGTLFRLSIAGLLHDIGFKELSPTLREKKRIDLTFEEQKEYETHPTRGMEILSRIQSIPQDLSQIVLHHHERDRGTGFPNRLFKSKIHPLARLIAVADEFCEMVIKTSRGPGISPKEAIEHLMTTKSHGLETSYVEALVKVAKK